jgi:hypothetical protein
MRACARIWPCPPESRRNLYSPGGGAARRHVPGPAAGAPDGASVPASPALVPAPLDMNAAAVLRRSVFFALSDSVAFAALTPNRVRCPWWPMADGLRLWLRQEGAPPADPVRASQNRLLQEWLAAHPVVHLGTFTALTSYCRQSGFPVQPLRQLIVQSVIEYAVATYGRDRLPALVQGIGRYETWAELAPAVFGVSVEQFKRGWQIYLQARG